MYESVFVLRVLRPNAIHGAFPVAASSDDFRLTHLRMLRYGWADGDISGTISKLARLERYVG